MAEKLPVSREPQDKHSVATGELRRQTKAGIPHCGSDFEGNNWLADLPLREAAKRVGINPDTATWDAVFKAAET